MKQSKLWLLLQTLVLAFGRKRPFSFPEPPANLPPIPVFSFYNQRHQDVWTKLGPKEAERLRCRRESITMDVDPTSGSDYKITRYRILTNNEEGLFLGNYTGYLSALKKLQTEKDSHTGLDIRTGSNETVGREFLLFTDEAARCGVFYVTEIEPTNADVRHGPICLLRVKTKERTHDAPCRQTFYQCLNHTSCLMEGVGGSAAICESKTYMCNES